MASILPPPDIGPFVAPKVEPTSMTGGVVGRVNTVASSFLDAYGSYWQTKAALANIKYGAQGQIVDAKRQAGGSIQGAGYDAGRAITGAAPLLLIGGVGVALLLVLRR